MTKIRNHAITIWDPDTEKMDNEIDRSKFQYCNLKAEICPKSKRRHIQGCYRLITPNSFDAMNKYFQQFSTRGYKYDKQTKDDIVKNPIWITECVRSLLINEKYVDKEDTTDIENPWHLKFGEIYKQGERTDIKSIIDKIKAKEWTLADVKENEPGIYSRYWRPITSVYHTVYGEQRYHKTKVKVYYGVPGSGKSKDAYNLKKSSVLFEPTITQAGNIWWNGYDYQPGVIIDDFKSNIDYSFMLKLTDRYPLKVDVKGEEPINFNSQELIITSNDSPFDWYKGKQLTDMEKHALLRRIDNLYFYDGRNIIDKTDKLQEVIKMLTETYSDHYRKCPITNPEYYKTDTEDDPLENKVATIEYYPETAKKVLEYYPETVKQTYGNTTRHKWIAKRKI